VGEGGGAVGENEPLAVQHRTAEETAKLLKLSTQSNVIEAYVGCGGDPANALVVAEEPFPMAMDCAVIAIAHVHNKIAIMKGNHSYLGFSLGTRLSRLEGPV